MATSPTQRTLNHLRKCGYQCATVEHWNPHSRIRQDLFGFGDILAVHPLYREILLIQCTSLTNIQARLKKALGILALAKWLSSGGKFQVWGWKKNGHRWEVKRIEVNPVDLDCREMDRPTRRKRIKVKTLFDE